MSRSSVMRLGIAFRSERFDVRTEADGSATYETAEQFRPGGAVPGRLNRDAAASLRYLESVPKTSVDVDQDIARQAAAILGTRTLRDTIDAALREVVHAKRRLELVALLSQEGRLDFAAADQAWGDGT
jgi:Arc/MetJ family transcription regulator